MEKKKIEKEKDRILCKGVDIKSKKFPDFFNKAVEKDISYLFYWQKPTALNIMMLLYNVSPIYKLKLLYDSIGSSVAYTTKVLNELENLGLALNEKKEGRLNTHVIITPKGKELMNRWMKMIKSKNKETFEKSRC